jgi:succinate-acetate transporter protein
MTGALGFNPLQAKADIVEIVFGERSSCMEAKLANPAPLGLMGFGMTTILLNLHNAGF